MNKKKRTIIYLILLLFGFYIIAGMILARRQDRLIFKPKTLDPSFVFATKSPSKEFKLPLSETDYLSILYLQTDSALAQVIYFHNQNGNIQTHLPEVQAFLQKKYNVFMVDYPGYGKSSGFPTERSIHESAEVVYKLAVSYMSADSTIIYGEGFGAAPAAYLAYKERNKKVILENPFYSLYDVAHHYFPIFPVKKYLKYEFPIHYYVARTLSPVILIYNQKDHGFLYRQTEKLVHSLNEKDTFINQSNQ